MFARLVRSRAALRGVGVFGLLALAGCGGASTVPVSGTVTQQGKPVEGATVTFVRGGGDIAKGELAIGKTDASGRYELTAHFGSQSSAAGAVPGEYKVTISKHVPPAGMSQAKYNALVEAANKIGETGAPVPRDKQPPPMVEAFPPHYSAQASTKLTAKVEKGAAEFNFTLD